MPLNKAIRIVYIKNVDDHLVSNIVYNETFLEYLSKYCDVNVLAIKSKDLETTLSALDPAKTDYCMADMKGFGPRQFILRAKNGIKVPFILMLHEVAVWFYQLCYVIPLLRPGDIMIAPSYFSYRAFNKISARHRPFYHPTCLDVRALQEKYHSEENSCSGRITYVGRILESKGLTNAVEAMPRLIKARKDMNLRIIGPTTGDPRYVDLKYAEKLQRLIIYLGLENKVELKGAVYGEEKFRLLRDSLCAVNVTTDLDENFPVSNLEAQSLGIPVITTRWAGNAELIRDGRNGFMIDVLHDDFRTFIVDNDKIVRSVEKLASDKNLARRMRARAASEALRFDYRRWAPRLIRHLADKKKKTAGLPVAWDELKSKRPMDFGRSFDRRVNFYLHMPICQAATFETWLSDNAIGLNKCIHPDVERKLSAEIFKTISY